MQRRMIFSARWSSAEIWWRRAVNAWIRKALPVILLSSKSSKWTSNLLLTKRFSWKAHLHRSRRLPSETHDTFSSVCLSNSRFFLSWRRSAFRSVPVGHVISPCSHYREITPTRQPQISAFQAVGSSADITDDNSDFKRLWSMLKTVDDLGLCQFSRGRRAWRVLRATVSLMSFIHLQHHITMWFMSVLSFS